MGHKTPSLFDHNEFSPCSDSSFSDFNPSDPQDDSFSNSSPEDAKDSDKVDNEGKSRRIRGQRTVLLFGCNGFSPCCNNNSSEIKLYFLWFILAGNPSSLLQKRHPPPTFQLWPSISLLTLLPPI